MSEQPGRRAALPNSEERSRRSRSVIILLLLLGVAGFAISEIFLFRSFPSSNIIQLSEASSKAETRRRYLPNCRPYPRNTISRGRFHEGAQYIARLDDRQVRAREDRRAPRSGIRGQTMFGVAGDRHYEDNCAGEP